MGIVLDRFNNIVAVEYNFTTMNNIEDNAFLDIEKGECALLQNVDVLDQNGGVTRRSGYTATAVTDAVHSGWSSPTRDIAYYVKSGVLYSFDGSSERYLMYIGDSPCCYVEVNDIVVFSNGSVIGSIDGGTASLFPEVPVQNLDTDNHSHKVKTVAGQCLEFYNGRLYVGSGTILYCTETFNVEQMDERFNIVAVFDSRITMIRRTSSGLFIGTETETFFLEGTDQQESGFSQKNIALYGVILGTDVFVNGENIKDGGSGEAALWCSTRGVCFGGQGGTFKNLTETYYTYNYGSKGCGLLRFSKGNTHYIANIAQEYNAFNQDTQPQLDVDSIEY